MIVEEKELDRQETPQEASEAQADETKTAEGESPKEANASEAEESPKTDEAGEEQPYEDDESPDESDDKKDKKKSLFSKDKKQNKLQERVDELEDRVKRQMAEFDNFRKRSEKEKSAMFETGAKSVIEKILPIVDNFERGLAGLSEEEQGTPFAEGMNMVYKQLIDELEKLDVKPIEAVGCEFNPELHNAVMQVASEEYESGTVAQELQKGYTYRDSVVRHSMVAVVE